MRIALYARISMALKQNPENQLRELRQWAEKANHEIEGEYIDEISSKDTRPQNPNSERDNGFLLQIDPHPVSFNFHFSIHL